MGGYCQRAAGFLSDSPIAGEWGGGVRVGFGRKAFDELDTAVNA